MHFDILTLFPASFDDFLSTSIVGRALEKKQASVRCWDIREFSTDSHRKVDDEPYGGGAGMVMTCQPLAAAIEAVRAEQDDQAPVFYLSPHGPRLTQPRVEELATDFSRIILLCGHYEGIDQRIRDHWIDGEISIGDYVLTGGELAAQVIMDAVIRLQPGVLGDDKSATEESFSSALDRQLEYPHYTRPAEFGGHTVPEVLLSGHHAKIDEWRREQCQEVEK